MNGVLGAAKYESILEGDAERSTVSARYGGVSVLMVRKFVFCSLIYDPCHALIARIESDSTIV